MHCCLGHLCGTSWKVTWISAAQRQSCRSARSRSSSSSGRFAVGRWQVGFPGWSSAVSPWATWTGPPLRPRSPQRTALPARRTLSPVCLCSPVPCLRCLDRRCHPAPVARLRICCWGRREQPACAGSPCAYERIQCQGAERERPPPWRRVAASSPFKGARAARDPPSHCSDASVLFADSSLADECFGRGWFNDTGGVAITCVHNAVGKKGGMWAHGEGCVFISYCRAATWPSKETRGPEHGVCQGSFIDEWGDVATESAKITAFQQQGITPGKAKRHRKSATICKWI